MKRVFDRRDVMFVIILVTVLIIVTSKSYSEFRKGHQYIDGFINFSILATMGEILSNRIAIGRWEKPTGFIWRVVLWGTFGMGVTLMFTIFNEGVVGAQNKGLLLDNNLLMTAFFASAIMNSTSGPVMMAIQRIGTTYIDLKYSGCRVGFKKAVEAVDWVGFLSFEVFITVPCIWIPANTFTFLLPEKIRILVAALLSMVLGLVLAIGKRKKRKTRKPTSLVYKM